MELTESQIEELISLGYDMHIYDHCGYPNDVDREDYEESEKARILNKGAAPQPAVQGGCACAVPKKVILPSPKAFCDNCNLPIKPRAT